MVVMVWWNIFLLIILTVLETACQSGGDCVCGVRQSGGPQACGRRKRVAGGDEADVGQFPWMALLVIRIKGENTKRCGGSLINDRYVLTAAHCARYSDDIEVILGDHDLTTRSEADEFRVKAETPFIVHKDYERSRKFVAYNFALLKLSRRVDFTRYPNIRPVCLPDSSYRDYGGEGGVVTGWGDTQVEYSVSNDLVKGKSSKPASVLQRLKLRLVNQDTCRQIYGEFQVQIQEDNLCASSGQGDSCTGDSGGGLVVPRCPGGYDELVGVISFGIGCRSTNKGVNIPGVNGRVSSVVDWIIKETSDGKSCKKPNETTSRRKETKCQCGIKKSIGIDIKITGGEEATENEFPWAVLLRISRNGRSAKRCGGTLINDRFVLTAGHCLPSAGLDVEVTLGEHDTRYREKELKLTATYKVHSGYKLDQTEGYLINDFALLRLSSRVDYDRYPHIRPICLPERGFTDFDNVLGTVTGWGKTQVEYFKRAGLVKGVSSFTSNTLQKLDTKLVRQDTCDDIYSDLNIQIRESNVCARSTRGDACGGDSGGGLVMERQGNHELVGVVSFGVGCNSTYKGEPLPGLFARVGVVVDWIRRETEEGQFCEQ